MVFEVCVIAAVFGIVAGFRTAKKEVRSGFTQASEEMTLAFLQQSEDRRETLRIAEKATEQVILVTRAYGDTEKEYLASGLQYDIMQQMQREVARYGRSSDEHAVCDGCKSGRSDDIDHDLTSPPRR